MKITLFMGNETRVFNNQHEIYSIHADETVCFELSFASPSDDSPSLFIEDHELVLTAYNKDNETKVFRSEPSCIFHEFFGLVIARLYINEQCIEYRFDVSIKKSQAVQVEQMIGYLTQQQDEIMRICLATTPVNNSANTDPEKLLITAETFVNTLMACRLELQSHLRKRLIPVKQPAWKSEQQSDIDPFDIIFNLDALEPVLGGGDVIVNGRSFTIKDTEITSLTETANVSENTILLGGIYSMRRLINHLLLALNQAVAGNKKELVVEIEYESLAQVLLRVTAFKIKHRAEQLLLRLEEFIRYFEHTLKINYNGEQRPIMTPFVRASRVYRRLFEQLHDWYLCNEASLESRNYLAKLRSVSKLYELVSLFKLIDYLHAKNWQVTHTQWLSETEFVPSLLVFEREGLKLTLHYEAKIFAYDENTGHLDLVDVKHSRFNHDYNYWCPDFIVRLENTKKTAYFILDAKYSSAESIKHQYLPSLLEKYFMNMAVYDANRQVLSQEPIMGIIALFPDKELASPVYMYNSAKYGIYKQPLKLPIITGFPLTSVSDKITYPLLDRLFEIIEGQLHF